MLSIYANAMGLLKDTFPQLMAVIHVAPNQHVEKYISATIHKWPVPAILLPGGLPHLKYNAFRVGLPLSSLCVVVVHNTWVGVKTV